eukprot:tig00020780_g13804.t1
MAGEGTRILSSLPLQILIYFNIWYAFIYFWLNVAIFIYKGTWLPYPPNTLGWEIAFIIVYAVVESCRLFLGSKGNKTEQVPPMVWFLLISAAIAFGNIYYIYLQIYVLRVDVVINAIHLFFVGSEVIFAIFTTLTFQRYRLFV